MSLSPALRRLADRPVLLFLSLVVNVLLLAVIGTHLLRPQPSGIDRIVLRLSDGLGTADRQVVETHFAQHRPALEAAVQSMRATRRRLDETIAANPFEPEATRAAFEQWRQSWSRVSSEVTATFLDTLPALSAEGRAEIAARSSYAPGRTARIAVQRQQQ